MMLASSYTTTKLMLQRHADIDDVKTMILFKAQFNFHIIMQGFSQSERKRGGIWRA